MCGKVFVAEVQAWSRWSSFPVTHSRGAIGWHATALPCPTGRVWMGLPPGPNGPLSMRQPPGPTPFHPGRPPTRIGRAEIASPSLLGVRWIKSEVESVTLRAAYDIHSTHSTHSTHESRRSASPCRRQISGRPGGASFPATPTRTRILARWSLARGRAKRLESAPRPRGAARSERTGPRESRRRSGPAP